MSEIRGDQFGHEGGPWRPTSRKNTGTRYQMEDNGKASESQTFVKILTGYIGAQHTHTEVRPG